jgi:tRNA-modifying protein YgfZ
MVHNCARFRASGPPETSLETTRKLMENVSVAVSLDHLGVLRARGPDAVQFLQGQLSNDVARLSTADSRSQLAGYHNPQGRVIALLRLVQLAPDDLLCVLPRELAPLVASRLSKFVLRAKVKIDDQSDVWQVTGLIASDSDAEISAETLRDARATAASVTVWVDASRLLVVAPKLAAATATDLNSSLPNSSPPNSSPPNASPHEADNRASAISAWHHLDIAAGLPQVYGSTSEEFVAQMLNLDLLEAIAFDKGCYTGQEVIARAHYRGRVKRRMQRFVTPTAPTGSAPTRFAPGASGQLADGRSFKVVDSVRLADGRVEFLAVAQTRGGEADDAASSTEADHARVDAEPLPLPYALPD